MSNRLVSSMMKFAGAAALVLVLASARTAHAQFGSPGGGGTGPVIGAGSYQGGPVNRGPIERVIDGVVTGKDDKPVSGAIVYLKESKSLAVKTYITDSTGHYRFGQLKKDVDYELWSELSGERSRTRRISSFDDRNTFTFLLKLDQTKTPAQ